MPEYRCLVFDHDDTVVDSAAALNFPAFQKSLALLRPGRSMTMEEYMEASLEPGFGALCTEILKYTPEEMKVQTEIWRAAVRAKAPPAFEGIRQIMQRQREHGGYLCVVSHSERENILRDYRVNRLPLPDLIFGWDSPPEQRKPSPYPLQSIMRTFGLAPRELLVIDDLRPGYEMARSCGTDFAAAGWAYDIPKIESAMKALGTPWFSSPRQLEEYLFGGGEQHQ